MSGAIRSRARVIRLPLTVIIVLGAITRGFGTETAPIEDLTQVRHQILKLKQNETAERKRMEDDEKLIRDLEMRLNQLDAKNRALEQTSQSLASTNRQMQESTTQQLQTLQSRIDSSPAATPFDQSMSRYLGTHQFTVVGDAAGGFIYDRQTAQNTFSLQFQPVVLYRMNDWILFEGSISASLPNGSGSNFSLPVATAQLFLNDYLEINAGIFDQPFGDWYEDQSPLWVNRFVTAPLLYGAEAIVPPTDIGIQLRGSAQWGALGQDVDYTTWVANGPSFDTALPTPVVGQTLNPQNNLGLSTNGRAFGGRIRFYPLPIDYNLGRLELGASTYDGKWQNSLWYNAWGIDFAYLRKNLQARGEFAQTYRQLPASSAPDNRQGWYLQVGYFLQDMPATYLNEGLASTIHKLELLARYSGVNQRAIVPSEISTDPGIGLSGSPSIFSPHAREVALGLDYWIEPSIVWQTEFDLELPQSGGSLISFNGSSPISTPVKSTPNDRAILTQLAIGF